METLTYSKLGVADLALGEAAFETRLADGRVVALSQLGLRDLVKQGTSCHLLSEYSTLTAALSTLGAGLSELWVTQNVTVSSNTTIPTNVVVKIFRGAVVTVNSGVTLTLNGPLLAGLYQVFDGAGTVVLGNQACPVVYPEWWGGAADNATDNATAFGKCVDMLASGGVVELQQGTYLSTVTIDHDTNELTWRGKGKAATMVKLNNSNSADILLDVQASRATIEHLTLQCNGNSQFACRLLDAPEAAINSVLFSSAVSGNGTGLLIRSTGSGGSFQGNIYDSMFEGCAAGAQFGLNTDADGANVWALYNCKATSCGDGFVIEKATGVSFFGCRAEANTSRGLVGSSGGSPTAANVALYNMYFENNTTAHIVIPSHASAWDLYNPIINGGTITNNATDGTVNYYGNGPTGARKAFVHGNWNLGSGEFALGRTSVLNRHVDIVASRSCADNTSQSLLDVTFVADTAQQFGAMFDYIIFSDTAATQMVECGRTAIAVTQDDSNNITGGAVELGNAQAIDAGATSLGVTFGISAGTNIVSVTVTIDANPNDTSTIHFVARCMGNADGIALASGVTAGA